MKRPEGFDQARRPVPPQRPAATPPPVPSSPAPYSRPPKDGTKTSAATEKLEPLPKTARQKQTKVIHQTKVVHQTAGDGTAEPEYSAKAEAKAAAHSAREARRELTRAARVRRKWERVEARRFTRRSRNRQATLAVVAGLVVVLVGMLAVAVYSPILALTTVQVDGADQIDTADVRAAVDDQVGTPLALLDFDRITRRLGKIPLIRSYVTETVPPNTLVIHIVERQGIGVIKAGSRWNLVDAAGVTLSTSTERPAGMPQIAVSGTATDSAAFAEATKVLRTLPKDLRNRVTRISANSDFSVTFVLKGKAGQKVFWGNAEQSDLKARVLAQLVEKNRSAKDITYNVASPLSAYISK